MCLGRLRSRLREAAVVRSLLAARADAIATAANAAAQKILPIKRKYDIIPRPRGEMRLRAAVFYMYVYFQLVELFSKRGSVFADTHVLQHAPFGKISIFLRKICLQKLAYAAFLIPYILIFT